MPKFVATDHSITVNGSAFSTAIQSVEVAFTADEIDATGFGTAWRDRIAGLRSASVTLNFYQGFGASEVDATLWPLLGSNATVVIKPFSTTTAGTNPAYTAVCLVTQYSPFTSAVGDIATLSVTWPSVGTVTRGTA